LEHRVRPGSRGEYVLDWGCLIVVATSGQFCGGYLGRDILRAGGRSVVDPLREGTTQQNYE